MSAGILESARNVLAGVLELGRTRFELFGTELREEINRLATAIVGGLAILIFGTMALVFAGIAIVIAVDPGQRVAAAVGVALFFGVLAGVVFWRLQQVAQSKPHPFSATITELRSDLDAIKS